MRGTLGSLFFHEFHPPPASSHRPREQAAHHAPARADCIPPRQDHRPRALCEWLGGRPGSTSGRASLDRTPDHTLQAASSPVVQALRLAATGISSPRGLGRATVPTQYLLVGLLCIWMWEARFLPEVREATGRRRAPPHFSSAALPSRRRSTRSSTSPSSRRLFTPSSRSTRAMRVRLLTRVWGVRRQAGTSHPPPPSSGALDPYGALGPDAWLSYFPWHVVTGRQPRLPAAPAPREPSATSVSIDLPVARVAAAPAPTTLKTSSGGAVPRTASGSVDYAALGEGGEVAPLRHRIPFTPSPLRSSSRHRARRARAGASARAAAAACPRGLRLLLLSLRRPLSCWRHWRAVGSPSPPRRHRRGGGSLPRRPR